MRWVSAISIVALINLCNIGLAQSDNIVIEGKLGIATSPVTDLHVAGNGELRVGRLNNTGGQLQLYGDSATSPQIRFFDNGTEKARIGVPTGSSIFQISAVPSTSNQFVVHTSGKVGVGISSPLADLHVAGFGEFRVGRSNNTGGQIQIYGGSTISPQIRVFDGGVEKARIGVSTGSSALQLNGKSSLANQLVIEEDGDVGVGVASPQSKLEVAGTIHAKSGGIKFPDGSLQSSAANIVIENVESGGPPVFPIPSPPGIILPQGPQATPPAFCMMMDLANTVSASCGGTPTTGLPITSSGQITIQETSQIIVWATATFNLGTSTSGSQKQIHSELVISDGTGASNGLAGISPIVQSSITKLVGTSLNPETSITVIGIVDKPAGTYNVGLRCRAFPISGGGVLWFVRGNMIVKAISTP